MPLVAFVTLSACSDHVDSPTSQGDARDAVVAADADAIDAVDTIDLGDALDEVRLDAGPAPPRDANSTDGRSCEADGCACDGRRTVCASACVDTMVDTANCGGCGLRCRSDQSCRAGSCSCIGGASDCAGRCVLVTRDVNNCGSCGHACAALRGMTATCVGGSCGAVCTAGWGDCDGDPRNGCEAEIQRDPANCGACGHACATDAGCSFGGCEGEGWARAVGAAGNDNGLDVAVSATGDVYFAGEFSGTLTSGSTTVTALGALDGFLAAFDASGTPRWLVRIGGGADEHHSSPYGDKVASVATDAAGNVYIAGTVAGDVDFGGGLVTGGLGRSLYVASFTPAGTFRWARRYGSLDIYAAANVATDASGNVYLVGVIDHTVDFGGGPLPPTDEPAAFAVSLTGAGEFRWSTSLGDSNLGAPSFVAFDSAGDGVIAMGYAGPLTVGGTTLDGGRGNNTALIGITSSGAVRWTCVWGGDTPWDYLGGIAFDDARNAYVVGRFYSRVITIGDETLTNTGATDAYVASVSRTGVVRWARRFGGTGAEFASGVAVDAANNVHVVGSFNGTADFAGTSYTSAGTTDAFLMRMGSDGSVRRVQRFGGDGDASANAVVALGSSVVIGGTFNDRTSFGGTELVRRGGSDAFVARVAP